MANRNNTFILKFSNVSGKTPTTAQLQIGEVAVNTADAKMYSVYTGGLTGATEVRQIGWDRLSTLTGGTISGTVIGNIFSANTISATTFYGNGANLVGVTASTVAAGATTQLQYNNSGVFSGSSNYYIDNVNTRITVSGGGGSDMGISVINMGTNAGDTAAVKLINSTTSATLFITPAGSSLPATTGFFTGSGNGFLIYPNAKQAARFLINSAYFFGDGDPGLVGIGLNAPTANLHIKAGTAVANTAPLKLTSGTNLTTPETGAIEYNGTNLFFTPSTVRKTIAFLESPAISAVTGPIKLIGVTAGTDSNLLSIDSSGNVHTISISSISGGSITSGAFLSLSGGVVSGSTSFSAATNPLQLIGLQTGTTDSTLLSVDISGNVHSYNISSITGLTTSTVTTMTGTTSVFFDTTSSFEGDFTTTAVTDTNVTAFSSFTFRIIPSDDHLDDEDSLLEGLMLKESNIMAGVGFTLNANAENNTWGTYNILYKIIN